MLKSKYASLRALGYKKKEPTISEVEEWLQKKYNIVIFDHAAPFVNPQTHKIQWCYDVKYCNTVMGWNGRCIIGSSGWSCRKNISKRKAVCLAIDWLLSRKTKRVKLV